MKYIFRYALLTNFTNKQHQITSEQLSEALKIAKFNLAGKNLEELIQQSNTCIQSLLKNSDKKDLESLINEAYPKGSLFEGDASEIISTWESEKHLIYKKMVADNVKSGETYLGLSWSVRNNISVRNGSVNNTKSVSLRVKDSEGELEIHCNKAQFQQLAESVNSAQMFISELLSN